MSKQLVLSCEAKGVTISPIPEAEKPHNTSNHPQTQTQTQTPPTEVEATSDSLYGNQQTNKQVDVFFPQLEISSWCLLLTTWKFVMFLVFTYKFYFLFVY